MNYRIFAPVTGQKAGAIAALAALAACTAPPPEAEAGEAGAFAGGALSNSSTRSARAASGQTKRNDTSISGGELEQGGWLRGRLPSDARSAMLGGIPVTADADGYFFAGLDRDAPREVAFTIKMEDGSEVSDTLTVKPRDWKIEHVNVARRSGGPSESFMRRRAPELAQIRAARAQNSESNGWRQSFIWPVEGRISGRFGSQRIYRGEPGSYHTGLDIAPGNGVPFVAPADGVVVLAAESPFSLEGNLIMIDHGQGLNSAFLHASKIAVKKGDVVKQGQYIGNVGASGRATGPHLHWSIKWRDARLDPLLFLPPQS